MTGVFMFCGPLGNEHGHHMNRIETILLICQYIHISKMECNLVI